MGSDERTTPGAPSNRVASFAERFRHGSSQLLLAFQALRRDSVAWKRYVRTCTLQAVVTVAVASFFVSTARTSSEGLREVRVRKAMEHVSSVEPKTAPSGAHASAPTAKHAAALPAAAGQGTAQTKRAAPSVSAQDTDEEDEEDSDSTDTQEENAEKAQEGFEKGEYKVPEKGGKIQMPRHGLYRARAK